MEEFIQRWHFVRSETLEILSSLTDEQLLYKPEGDRWQTLYYQFGCIGRTQLVYANAAEIGDMDFSLFTSQELPAKDAFKTVASIREFLEDSNKQWLEALQTSNHEVKWPGGNKSLELHIACLAEHERLHHGQMISYFTLAGITLPPDFTSNWGL